MSVPVRRTSLEPDKDIIFFTSWDTLQKMVPLAHVIA